MNLNFTKTNSKYKLMLSHRVMWWKDDDINWWYYHQWLKSVWNIMYHFADTSKKIFNDINA